MAKEKKRVKRIIIRLGKETKFGVFSLGKRINIEDVRRLRSLFSDEKAKILFIIKTRQPNSLYDLAKILERDFKAVRKDVKDLEYYGFIKLVKVGKGKRKSLKPILAVDEVLINFIL